MPAIEGKIRYAVVGTGHIGKRHSEMIRRNAESELVAICDVRPKESLGLEAYQDVPFLALLMKCFPADWNLMWLISALRMVIMLNML